MDVQRVVCGGEYCGIQVARAVRRGELPPATTCVCTDCGHPAREYDHRDYSLPLAVAPVCRRCNARRGRALPRRWAEGELLSRLKHALAQYRVVPWAVDYCVGRAERVCVRIEKHTGGAITRQHLRPDLFGPSNERLPLALGPNPYA